MEVTMIPDANMKTFKDGSRYPYCDNCESNGPVIVIDQETEDDSTTTLMLCAHCLKKAMYAVEAEEMRVRAIRRKARKGR